MIHRDSTPPVVPYFKNTRNLNANYPMTTEVLGAVRGSPTLLSNVNKNIIDLISRALLVKTVKSMSRRARFFPSFSFKDII